MRARDIIGDMVRRIVERGSPERIILYGSHARHEAGPESDVDLLVLFPELNDRRRMVADLYDAVIGTGLPKDIVVATTGEYQRYKDVVNTIHWSAAQDGRVLYERQA